MRQLVEDETGGKWAIMPEDPAWWAVKELRKDMEYIVLPRYMIQTGVAAIEEEIVDDVLEGAAKAYKGTGSPALGRTLARLLRLSVCLDRVGEMDYDDEEA